MNICNYKYINIGHTVALKSVSKHLRMSGEVSLFSPLFTTENTYKSGKGYTPGALLLTWFNFNPSIDK